MQTAAAQAAVERDARRRRHEAFLQRYTPSPQENTALTNLSNPEAWRNIAIETALSEGREVPELQFLINIPAWDWEYFTDNGSKEFLEDLEDYVASGRASGDGISEDVCSRIQQG